MWPQTFPMAQAFPQTGLHREGGLRTAGGFSTPRCELWPLVVLAGAYVTDVGYRATKAVHGVKR